MIAIVSVVRDTQDAYTDVCVATGIVVAALLTLPVAGITGRLYSHTYDGYLYLADRDLGLDGLGLARLCYGTPWLRKVLTILYDSIPLWVAIAWACERSVIMLRSLVIATVIGAIAYNFVPAAGPAHAFPGFPWITPHPAAAILFVASDGPRNAFPST